MIAALFVSNILQMKYPDAEHTGYLQKRHSELVSESQD